MRAETGRDLELVGGDHVVQLVCVGAGAVEDELGVKHLSVPGLQLPAAVRRRHVGHFGVQEELHAVAGSVFTHGDHQRVGADDAARGAEQRPDSALAHSGPPLQQSRPVQDLGGNAIFLAALMQAVYLFHVLFGSGQDHGSAALEGNLQLTAQVIKHPITAYIVDCLQRTRLRVKAAVDHCGVSAAGSRADIAALFQDSHSQLIARQRPGRSSAAYAGANNYDIPHRSKVLLRPSILR